MKESDVDHRCTPARRIVAVFRGEQLCAALGRYGRNWLAAPIFTKGGARPVRMNLSRISSVHKP